MGLVRPMLIAIAAGSCAATPAAAVRQIAVEQDMCIVRDGAACLAGDSAAQVAARGADLSDITMLARPEAEPDLLDAPYDADVRIATDVRVGDRSATVTRRKISTLPDAANWALLAGGFCLISFTLRGSREPMLQRPQRVLPS